MRITVRFFAGHRERAGTSQTDVEVPVGATVQDVFDAVVDRHPQIDGTQTFTSFARNRQVVSTSELVADGDEIALLQPVSGG